jgi:hypothetical protein
MAMEEAAWKMAASFDTCDYRLTKWVQDKYDAICQQTKRLKNFLMIWVSKKIGPSHNFTT